MLTAHELGSVELAWATTVYKLFVGWHFGNFTMYVFLLFLMEVKKWWYRGM